MVNSSSRKNYTRWIGNNSYHGPHQTMETDHTFGPTQSHYPGSTQFNPWKPSECGHHLPYFTIPQIGYNLSRIENSRHPGPQTSRPSDIQALRHPGPQTSRPSDIQALGHPGPRTSRPSELLQIKPVLYISFYLPSALPL